MSAAKKTIPVPTIKELLTIVQTYQVARADEVQTLTELRELAKADPSVKPKDYKSPEILDVHFDCALLALRALKPILEANLLIEAPGN